MPRADEHRVQLPGDGRPPVTPGRPEAEDGYICASPQGRAVYEQVCRFAPVTDPVLITGPTGSGKERVAGLLHRRSRRSGELIVVHCGNVSDSLFEAELFGHTKGAYTGANRERAGLIAASSGGTLFLDEVGELPLTHQEKLLRVLSEQNIRAVGSHVEVPVDIRVVAATNRDVFEMLASGRWRRDFYARLRLLHIRIPPFRERPEDAIELARQLAHRRGFDRGAIEQLAAAVRELSEHANAWPFNGRDVAALVVRTQLSGLQSARQFLQAEWQRLLDFGRLGERHPSDPRRPPTRQPVTAQPVTAQPERRTDTSFIDVRAPRLDGPVQQARFAELAGFIQQSLRRVDGAGIKAAKRPAARALASLLARCATVTRHDITRLLDSTNVHTIKANVDKLCEAGLLHPAPGRERYVLAPGILLRFLLQHAQESAPRMRGYRDRGREGDWTLLHPDTVHPVAGGDRLFVEVTTQQRMSVSVCVISHRGRAYTWAWTHTGCSTQSGHVARYPLEFDQTVCFEHVLVHVAWPSQRGARPVADALPQSPVPLAEQLLRARSEALAERKQPGCTFELCLHHR